MSIFYGKQFIDQNDVDEVTNTLRSDYLTQGPKVTEFENLISSQVDSKFCVAVNSATSALHLSCLAIGIKKGDIVWTSSISFVASSNCALYCDAEIDFLDIDSETFNIDITALEVKLNQAKEIQKLPKAIVIVHMCGNPLNAKRIYELSKIFGFIIIEDSSHALGASTIHEKIGSCKYSDLSVFSFHPVKMITTGEGGCVTTNNSAIYEKLLQLRSHGITREESNFTNESDGPWYYEQNHLGFNYRMNDIQASLGISQIKKLDHFVKVRNEIAKKYETFFSSCQIALPIIDSDVTSSFHLYVIRNKQLRDLKDKKSFFEACARKGLILNLNYMPIYKHPHYQKLGFDNNYCLNAEQYYIEAASIPIYVGLTEKQMANAVGIIESF